MVSAVLNNCDNLHEEMEDKPGEVLAEQVISEFQRKDLGQQSTTLATLTDNIILPMNRRIAHRISRCETTQRKQENLSTSCRFSENEIVDMENIVIDHPHSPVSIDKTTAEKIYDHFPTFIIGVSLVQIFIFYSCDVHFMIMKFAYDPSRRHEVWRFLSPMIVHINWSNLWSELIMQLIFGVFLEIVHKWKRVAVIYLASVFGGILCVSVLDNYVYTVGVSSAVMGLIFSHLSTILLNWNETERKFSRLFCVSAYIVYDVGSNIYKELYLGNKADISYAATFGGAVTGFLVSILVLKNFQKRPWEETLQKICVGILVALFVIILSMNVMLADYYPTNEWNFDYEKSYYAALYNYSGNT